jgi:putative Mg2+ transporter-C (MgtC) family protein
MQPPQYPLDALLKFGLAIVLSGLVGVERQRKARGAGLRTHILVCLGATLLMIVSELITNGRPGVASLGDHARIAAGIVTGIGFLGAGTILTVGNELRGLTTAAMIWFVAALGIAIGAGYYLVAICATVSALFVVVVLEHVERMLPASRLMTLIIHMPREEAELDKLKDFLREKGFEVSITRVKLTENAGEANVHLELISSRTQSLESLAASMRERFPFAEEINFKR